MTSSWHTCPLPTPKSMTDIANGSQITFPRILDKATESSQNNSPNSQENELTPELLLICPCWSVSHLFRKLLKRPSSSWGHDNKAINALPWLHVGICLGQSQNSSLISLGIGRGSCPGCLESNQHSLTSKQNKPARAPQSDLEPYIWPLMLL